MSISSTGVAITWSELQHRSRPRYGRWLPEPRTCEQCGREYNHGGHKYCSRHCRDDVARTRRAARYPADRLLRPQKKADGLKQAKIAISCLPVCPICKQHGPLNYKGTCSDRCLQERLKQPTTRKKVWGVVQAMIDESRGCMAASWEVEEVSLL